METREAVTERAKLCACIIYRIIQKAYVDKPEKDIEGTSFGAIALSDQSNWSFRKATTLRMYF